jgi:hypothetical protein
LATSISVKSRPARRRPVVAGLQSSQTTSGSLIRCRDSDAVCRFSIPAERNHRRLSPRTTLRGGAHHPGADNALAASPRNVRPAQTTGLAASPDRTRGLSAQRASVLSSCPLKSIARSFWTSSQRHPRRVSLYPAAFVAGRHALWTRAYRDPAKPSCRPFYRKAIRGEAYL